MAVWSKVRAPLTSGVITAVVSLFIELPDSLENFLLAVEHGSFLRIPRVVTVSTTGFLMGYGVRSMVSCFRWHCLKVLLKYRSWMRKPNSTVTKIWRVLLEILIGPGPHDTFEFQNVIPHLPVPRLQDSCDKYLKSMRPFLTHEEFSKTKSLVERFIEKDGPILQNYIIKRAQTTDNWLSDWWLDYVWLSRRDPLPAYANSYILGCPAPPTWNQVHRAANLIYHCLRFRELIISKQLPVLMLLNIVPICMNSYRTLFGTVRIPGVEKDTLVTYEDSKHIIVIRNGVFYSLDVYCTDVCGKTSILTAQEIRHQLDMICFVSEEDQIKYAVSALTSQYRSAWARQRNILDQGKNSDALYAIESALFVVCLDKAEPEDINDQARRILMGTGYNRWFDKNLSLVVFGNARAGLEVELSSSGVSLYCHLWEYLLYQEKYDENGCIHHWDKPLKRYLKPPESLKWYLENFEAALEIALDQHRKLLMDLDVFIWCSTYGKTWLKENLINPDGYLEMAILLAYYRLMHEVPKTFESSSTRMFALGRMDVIRPASMVTVDWLKVMDDETIQRNIKLSRLLESIQYQNSFQLEAINGYGWDSHLFGLHCASKELNHRIPSLFKDKAWLMSDILYTIHIPTKITDKWYPELCSLGTGITPTFKHALSVSYLFFSDELVNFHSLAWKSMHPMIGVRGFSEALNKALVDMKRLFDDPDEPEVIRDSKNISIETIPSSHNLDTPIIQQDYYDKYFESTHSEIQDLYHDSTASPSETTEVCFIPTLQ